jgi:hypothetical protein
MKSLENEFKYQNEDLIFDNKFVNDYSYYLIFRSDTQKRSKSFSPGRERMVLSLSMKCMLLTLGFSLHGCTLIFLLMNKDASRPFTLNFNYTNRNERKYIC